MSNVSQSLELNKNFICKALHYQLSNDVQIRDIDICINSSTIKSFFVSYDGLVNTDLINNYIIRALMNKNNTYERPSSGTKSFLKKKNTQDESLIDTITNSILHDLQITPSSDFDFGFSNSSSWNVFSVANKCSILIFYKECRIAVQYTLNNFIEIRGWSYL